MAAAAGDSGTAGAFGDPHLLTVSGTRYDVQAGGEFVMLRSADGSVEIQNRQEPFPKGGPIAVNTAIAARVAGHRVAVYSTPSGVELRVDGSPASGPVAFGADASVVAYRTGYAVTFPDGTKLWALSFPPWGISLFIRPTDELAAQGVGLLGPVTAPSEKLPALPDGTILPKPTTDHDAYVDVYQRLAPAWRVTDQTTLFDYDGGRTTASYDVPGFPAESALRTIDQLDPGVRSAAEAKCAAVTAPELHESCVYDVALTGADDYADVYATTQAAVEETAPTAQPSPSAGPPTTPLPAGVTKILDNVNEVRGLAIGPDGLLYVSGWDGDGNGTRHLWVVDISSGHDRPPDDRQWRGQDRVRGQFALGGRVQPRPIEMRALTGRPADAPRAGRAPDPVLQRPRNVHGTRRRDLVRGPEERRQPGQRGGGVANSTRARTRSTSRQPCRP